MRPEVSAGTASGAPSTASLEICLSIEKTQPLTGTACIRAGEPVAFVGWLEMLRVIADLTEAAEQTPGRAPEIDVNPTG